MINLENVTKKYDRILALRNIDLKFKKGGIYGILGSNGAGKTTLLSLIAGLRKPTTGEIDNNISFGFTPQHGVLPSDETAASFFVYLASLRGVDEHVAKKELISLLHTLQISELLEVPFGQMSNGQQKVLSIVQAFIGNPSLILLDEPTAGLDPKISRRVISFLKKEHKKRTYIITSHQFNIVEYLCTHVIILHEGSIRINARLNTIKDVDHVVNIKLKKIPKKFIAKVSKMKEVRHVLINEEENSLRILHRKPITQKLLQALKVYKCDILEFNRGEPLDDFFLKYL